MEGFLVQFMAMRLLVGMSNDVGVLAGNSMGLILDARGVHNNIHSA